MDTLLLALLACLLGETAGRAQSLIGALHGRFGRPAPLLFGAALAAMANAALAATVGAWIAPMLGLDARRLLLALALIAAGAAMLWRTRPPDPLAGWRIGPFLTATLGLFILELGESASFLITGLAVAHGEPLWAGAGGAIGLFAAAWAAVVLGPDLFSAPGWRWLRRGGGALFAIIGVIMGMRALGLA